MNWGSLGIRSLPFAARLAKRWWRKRDLARNLSQAVISALEGRRTRPPGIREELVSQWLSVRDDAQVTTLVRELLDDRTSDREQRLRRRIRELLTSIRR
jgi:hypothetical protein